MVIATLVPIALEGVNTPSPNKGNAIANGRANSIAHTAAAASRAGAGDAEPFARNGVCQYRPRASSDHRLGELRLPLTHNQPVLVSALCPHNRKYANGVRCRKVSYGFQRTSIYFNVIRGDLRQNR